MSDDDYIPEDVDYGEPQPDDPETDAADEPEDSEDAVTDEDVEAKDDIDAKAMSEGEETTEEKRPHGRPAAADRRKPDPFLSAATTARKVYIVAPHNRRTSDVVQPAEAAHLIAMRSAHIAEHAVFFVDAKGLHDPVAIAYLEFISRRNPLIIRRQVGTLDGAALVEEWFPNEMVHPQIAAPPGMSRG